MAGVHFQFSLESGRFSPNVLNLKLGVRITNAPPPPAMTGQRTWITSRRQSIFQPKTGGSLTRWDNVDRSRGYHSQPTNTERQTPRGPASPWHRKSRLGEHAHQRNRVTENRGWSPEGGGVGRAGRERGRAPGGSWKHQGGPLGQLHVTVVHLLYAPPETHLRLNINGYGDRDKEFFSVNIKMTRIIMSNACG